MEEGVRVQVQGHDGQRCAAVRSLPRQSRAQIAPANGQNLKVQIAPGANSVPGTELDTSLRPSLQLTPSESPSAPGVPSPSLPFFTNRDSDSDSEPRSRAAVMVTRVRIEPQSSSTRRGQVTPSLPPCALPPFLAPARARNHACASSLRLAASYNARLSGYKSTEDHHDNAGGSRGSSSEADHGDRHDGGHAGDRGQVDLTSSPNPSAGSVHSEGEPMLPLAAMTFSVPASLRPRKRYGPGQGKVGGIVQMFQGGVFSDSEGEVSHDEDRDHDGHDPDRDSDGPLEISQLQLAAQAGAFRRRLGSCPRDQTSRDDKPRDDCPWHSGEGDSPGRGSRGEREGRKKCANAGRDHNGDFPQEWHQKHHEWQQWHHKWQQQSLQGHDGTRVTRSDHVAVPRGHEACWPLQRFASQVVSPPDVGRISG